MHGGVAPIGRWCLCWRCFAPGGASPAPLQRVAPIPTAVLRCTSHRKRFVLQFLAGNRRAPPPKKIKGGWRVTDGG